ncbi:hypothetical protein J4E93_005340 [Alternaria ventricosa]|uniref:uncharacterized protein n=1 Tax=Alternaria ventricosa TaxID=1187951 RepID=UPI0020C38ACD|nr:uncharacterized protein J4E93_005340 [Alternaria ventricosa]KAI4645762.1 hypothetical protein J4E93_005340 [Alternaria ventricosa]
MSSSSHPVAPTTAQRDADYHYSQQLTKLQDEIMDLNKIIENTAADHRREVSVQARAMTCLNMKILWLTYKLDPILKVDKVTAERMKRLFPEVAEYFTLD